MQGAKRSRVLGLVGVTLVVALALAPAVALWFVLYSETGTRFAASIALDWYDESIPGSATVGSISGRLGDRFVLREISLRDRAGDALVAVRELTVEWSPACALEGRLRVDIVAIRGAEVHLDRDGTGIGFLDLAPDGIEPSAPASGLGPDLPFVLRANLTLKDAVLYRARAEGGPDVIAYVSALDLSLAAAGKRARVDVRSMSASAPPVFPGPVDLRFVASWNEPVAALTDLRATAELGSLSIRSAGLDVLKRVGFVVAFAEGDAGAVSETLGVRLEHDFGLALTASGGLKRSTASIAVLAGPEVAFEIAAVGSLRPDLDVAATLLAFPFDLDDTNGPGGNGPSGTGNVHISGTGPSDLSLVGEITCRECFAPPFGRFDLGLEADMRQGQGALRADLAFAGVRLLANGWFSSGELERACATAAFDDISYPGSVLGGLLDLPSLAGALAVEADCERRAGALVCRGDARGRDLRIDTTRLRRARLTLSISPLEPDLPFEGRLEARGLRLGGQKVSRLEASAAGTVRQLDVALRARMPGRDFLLGEAGIDLRDGVAISLDRLRGRYRGVVARLERPAAVAYRDDALEVGDLALLLGGGRVAVDGVVSRSAQSDFTARVADVKLERLPEAIVGRGATGNVKLSLRVRGEPDRPRVRLRASVVGLGWGAEPLGDLRVAARYDGSRIVVDGGLERDGGEAGRLRASVPLKLSLREPGVEPLEHLPLELRLDLLGVDLARLASIAPGLDLGGELDARLVVEGTMRSPRGTLVASGKGLVRRDLDLGDADLFASFSRDHVYLDLNGVGGIARSSKLTATLELAGSPLEDLRTRLAPDGFNRVTLVARGLRLASLRALLPEVEIDGVVDIDAQLSGNPGNPFGRLEASSPMIAVSGVEAGPLGLVAVHSDGLITGELRIEGGAARLIEASAAFPIRIALDALPRWDRESRHEADVRAVGLDLRRLQAIAVRHGVDVGNLELSGLIDAALVAEGTPDDPAVDATLTSTDLSWSSHRLGDTIVSLVLGQGQARLQARIVQARGRWANLVVDAPYLIETDPFEVRWNDLGTHSLRLEAVGIDKAVLAPFWEPRAAADLRLDIDLDGTGNADDFALRGEWNGALLASGIRTLALRGKLDASFRDQSVWLELGPRGAPVASVTARSEVLVDRLLSGEGNLRDAKLAAEARIPGLELKQFATFLPRWLYGMEGLIEGDIRVSGTIGAPQPRGRLELHRGAITIVDLGQRLREIEIRADMDGRRIRLEDLRFSSGQGRGNASGEMVLGVDSFRGTLDGALRQFPFMKPGLPEMTVDSDIGFSFAADQRSTEAEMTLKRTRIKLLTRQRTRIPEDIPPTSTIVFGTLGGKPDDATAPPPRSADPQRTKPVRFVLDAIDPIEITGPDVFMRWSGQIEAVSSLSTNDVNGRIEAEGGRFWLLGNTFVIDSGEVSLPASGPLDPYIQLIARADTREALVTVEIRGRLSRPDLTLTSDPVMSQYQILTLLLTGRSDTGEGGEGSEEVQAQAASLLMAFNNPTLERQLNDRLGIDRVGLSMGQSMDEPILAVGKRLGRHFYVETEYHHNAPSTENRTGGRVEYYIDPRWSVETFYGDANKGGIDLFWRKRFGRPKPKRFSIPDESADAEPAQ